MAKKDFMYRGKTLDELQKLSKDEFVALIPSRSRRSFKRGYTDAAKLAERRILEKDDVKTHAREVIILPQMVGKSVHVHNGKEFVQVRIVEDMLGHRLGEFALTRKQVKHGSAGVGATRSSAALSVR